MKKEMTREALTDDLLDMLLEGNDMSDMKQLLRGSWKGYDDTSDADLIKEYWDILGECLEEDGYTGVIVIEEDN